MTDYRASSNPSKVPSTGNGTLARNDQHSVQRARQTETLSALRSHRSALQSKGIYGWDLFEQMATLGINHRIKQERTNRCDRCWHDKKTGCICDMMPSIDINTRDLLTNVKLLILMHHKEYLCAGNSAKLLLQMIPKDKVELYVFGRTGDLDRLAREVAVDPLHTLTLWPGEDSKTIEQFLSGLPNDSLWRQKPDLSNNSGTISQGNTEKRLPPLLRVVALDGTYSNAKHMHKALRKLVGDQVVPQHVALHPTSMSIFRRAQKQYGASVAQSLKSNNKLDHRAMRVSTAEACALLLTKLGTAKEVQDLIVEAVLLNNRALAHNI